MPHRPWWIALQCSPPDAAQDWLGHWALQFSPRVTWLEEAWLVELGQTLCLWGGPTGVVRAMQRQMPRTAAPDVWVASGHTALLALANWRHAPVSLWAPTAPAMPEALRPPAPLPTPTAADDLFARQPPAEPDAFAGQGWQRLPLHTLGAARSHAEVLARLGVRTWGQLARLPRDGVARRWGNGLLVALDRALGRLPEDYRWLAAPAAFDQTLPCTHHLTQADALMLPAQQLLTQLHDWLAQRQLGALALRWRWTHDHRRHATHEATEGGFDVHTAQPVQQLAHLLRLTTERLARQRLASPVVALRLQTLALAPWAAITPDWLAHNGWHHGAPAMAAGLSRPGAEGPAAQAPLAEHELIERLQARLGESAVIRWQVCSAHLPEAAQLPAPPQGATASVPMSERGQATPPIARPAVDAGMAPGGADAWWPTWVCHRPVPLAMRGHRPCYQGELELLAGPHRLELAAWEGPGCATVREHFVARSPGAGLLWVFRQPGAEQAWFLQGWYA